MPINALLRPLTAGRVIDALRHDRGRKFEFQADAVRTIYDVKLHPIFDRRNRVSAAIQALTLPAGTAAVGMDHAAFFDRPNEIGNHLPDIPHTLKS